MSTKIPSYGKVLNLGSVYTENALVGEVIVQEKIDGSQFRWGITEEKELIIASRNKQIHPEMSGMFKLGVESVMRMKKHLDKLEGGTYFYGEYLQKPKHNTLNYERVPFNNIVLFDVIHNANFVDRKTLEGYAELFEIDVIPEFYRGRITKADLVEFHKKDSFLGKEKVEGIVIKNYNEKIIIGGQLFPLFTKYVREEFRERHQKNPMYRSQKQSVAEYVQTFKNENRWKKCYEYCRDAGDLVNEPKDIGTIIKRIMVDIDEEETENIKKFLYEIYIKQIKGCATHGFPEWYKDLLLERVKDGN